MWVGQCDASPFEGGKDEAGGEGEKCGLFKSTLYMFSYIRRHVFKKKNAFE
jgi:hypothetical protein